MIKQKLLSVTLITSLWLLQGCSFSTSSESGSDSSESLFSSSTSSSQSQQKYSQEVADYTMAYVKSSVANADYSSFAKGVGDIATKSGISNWEQESSSYVAIGKGLKRAGSTGVAFDTYKSNLAHGDATKMQSIQQGYDSLE